MSNDNGIQNKHKFHLDLVDSWQLQTSSLDLFEMFNIAVPKGYNFSNSLRG